MFDKLAPTPITEKKYRYLMICAMVWMFTGAWVDASAHTYIIEDIETFFTPWHALLYSGYGFVVISAVYVKNKMKDYKFDVGVLGATIFAVGGGSDAIWHTLLGIETGVEPLITPSHLMLFLGSFLMLDHVFASRPEKDPAPPCTIKPKLFTSSFDSTMPTNRDRKGIRIILIIDLSIQELFFLQKQQVLQ